MDFIKRDELFEKNIAAPIAWNSYLFIALQFLIIFSILTALMEDYLLFAHHGQPWTIGDFILGALYLLVILLSLARMVKKLPMAAIMLAAPTIPLIMLILTVTSLPILHILHKKTEQAQQTVKEPRIEIRSVINKPPH